MNVSTVSDIKDASLQVLERNSRRHDGHLYFAADATKRFQLYWDSCLQAIATSVFDGRRAEEEMYTLLSTQFPDGCMPYMTAWEKPPFPWSVFTRVANWIGEDGRTVLSTQPMLSPVAAWEIYKRTQNRAFLERLAPGLAREVDYMGVQRDLLGDGLAVIVNVLEAGTNESPVYDEIMKLPRPRGLGPLMHVLFYLKVSGQMARYRRLGFDLERIAERGSFLVEDMTSNALFCRSLLAMGDILGELGDGTAAAAYRRLATLLAERIEASCWDPEDAFFYTRYGERGERKLSRVKTASGLLALFSGLISREKAVLLVERHLVNEDEFQTPWPVSFVSIDERSYRSWSPRLPFASVWRTGTWVCINWMLFMGLKWYGYGELASQLAQSSISMVERAGGFREFYNSWNGRGCGVRDCGMATLVADMLERL